MIVSTEKEMFFPLLQKAHELCWRTLNDAAGCHMVQQIGFVIAGCSVKKQNVFVPFFKRFQGPQPVQMGNGEGIDDMLHGIMAFFILQCFNNGAVLVPRNRQNVHAAEEVRRSGWIQRTIQAVSQVEDDRYAPPFDICQHGFQSPAIAVYVGEDRDLCHEMGDVKMTGSIIFIIFLLMIVKKEDDNNGFFMYSTTQMVCGESRNTDRMLLKSTDVYAADQHDTRIREQMADERDDKGLIPVTENAPDQAGAENRNSEHCAVPYRKRTDYCHRMAGCMKCGSDDNCCPGAGMI